MKRLLIACFATFALHAATTANDTSCDISVTPAATLLLPYFEVDLAAAAAETTLFTITNTASLPQAVQVTLWTDYDVPVIAFNLYLTGYEVQSVNLFDVLANGRIPASGYDVSHHGPLSGGDNPLLREGTCNNLPSAIPAPALARMRSAFTTGKLDACNTAGSVHTNAVGYATIDVVGACSPRLPNDSTYYRELIRFNNVLIGDYLQFDGRANQAQGSPMVHIRAIPEGGTVSSREGKPEFTVNATRTFYSRFQHPSAPKLDARQPLPAVFAVRWISGGTGAFETFLKIWREGREPAGTACRAPALATFMEMVRFDEDENPTIHPPPPPICTLPPTTLLLPGTSMTNIENSVVFPSVDDRLPAGWLYLNLDNCNRDAYASQNWVIASMRADNRFSADIDAAALGNGCSLPVDHSDASAGWGARPIGPAPNVRP